MKRQFFIEHYILPKIKPSNSKGNGNTGRGGRKVKKHRPTYNNNGIYFTSGMGCTRHANCFTCPFDECQFMNGTFGYKDLKYMSNAGNGIQC